jgi:hypothetical protein
MLFSSDFFKKEDGLSPSRSSDVEFHLEVGAIIDFLYGILDFWNDIRRAALIHWDLLDKA